MSGRICRVLFYFVHGEWVTNKDSCCSFFGISCSRKNQRMIMLINEQAGIFIFLSHSARNRGNPNITISNISGEWLNELCHCHNHMKATCYCIFKVNLAYECVLTSWTCKWESTLSDVWICGMTHSWRNCCTAHYVPWAVHIPWKYI